MANLLHLKPIVRQSKWEMVECLTLDQGCLMGWMSITGPVHGPHQTYRPVPYWGSVAATTNKLGWTAMKAQNKCCMYHSPRLACSYSGDVVPVTAAPLC